MRRVRGPDPATGFTFVEIMVALALGTIVIGVVYQLWHAAQLQTAIVTQRADVYGTAQRRLHAVTREIACARRLIYPAPGGPSLPGVGIVAADGSVVMFRLREDATRAGLFTLLRAEVSSGKTTDVLGGIAELACRTPPVPTGREPDLVHLTVTLKVGQDANAALITSARLRALDIICPVNR